MTENPQDQQPGYEAGYQAGWQAAQGTAQGRTPGGPPAGQGFPPPAAGYRRLTRSRTDAPVSGVCGGLAQYLGVDPTLVRILVGLAMLVAFPVAEIVYVVMWAVVPKE